MRVDGVFAGDCDLGTSQGTVGRDSHSLIAQCRPFCALTQYRMDRVVEGPVGQFVVARTDAAPKAVVAIGPLVPNNPGCGQKSRPRVAVQAVEVHGLIPIGRMMWVGRRASL